MEYLHTMIRVTDLKATIAFFDTLGFVEEAPRREREGPLHPGLPGRAGRRRTGAKDQAPMVELTYNWDPEDYTGGRNFGHLAYQVDDIYAICASSRTAA